MKQKKISQKQNNRVLTVTPGTDCSPDSDVVDVVQIKSLIAILK